MQQQAQGGEHLHDGSGNQVNFGLGCDVGSEEGKASIGSIAGIDSKITLAEDVIRQADNCWEFRGGRKEIQSREDLMLGGTGCHQVNVLFVRQQEKGGLVHH
jgi:hypothetical protein